MSRFNKTMPKSPTKTVNLAGGVAYKQESKAELMSLVLSSFLKNTFYESKDQRIARLQQLLREVEPLWAAKLAIYARHVFGMRTVTHVIAAELGDVASGRPWAKSFYGAVVKRADDMSEILGYRYNNLGLEATHAMRKGFASVLNSLDAYALGKYRQDGKQFSMNNVVALCRPKNASQAICDLMDEKLEPPETWEVLLSKAGEQKTSKADVWKKLLLEDKLGHFALLRNLNNLLKQTDRETIALANVRLTDEAAIKRSLVMPFRYVTAYKQVEKDAEGDASMRGHVLGGVSRACDISLANVPKFVGATLVALDCSASMGSFDNPDSPLSKGLIMAAALVKANGADMMMFADDARYMAIDPTWPTLTACKNLSQYDNGGGTNFFSIFRAANRKYDRIILLSDMEGWGCRNYWGDESKTVPASFEAYKKRLNSPGTKLWSFDLNGYGTLMFPAKNVFAVSGWSDQVFELMTALENGDIDKMTQAVDDYQI